MARPERNNIDYFPFYCDEGKKMFYIEERYGNDGFTVFIKILRELAKTDFHYLDLSKKTTLMFLSAKCKVSIELLIEIITDLVELEKFDNTLWEENKIIWCHSFIESIQDAYLKRKNNCITYEGLLLRLEGLGVRKPIKCKSKAPVNTQSIVEETIKDNTIINSMNLSELKSSDFTDSNYFNITIAFYELFKKNMIEAGAKLTTLEKAKGNWINHIRLLIEKDGYTIEDLQKVFKFLQNDEFWKQNILSTSKLREQFDKLIIKTNGKETIKNSNGATPEKLAELLTRKLAK